MLFISRVIFIFITLVAATHATTIAVPIDNEFKVMDTVFINTTVANKPSSFKSKAAIQATSTSVSALSLKGMDETLQPVLLLRLSFTDQDFSYSRSDFQNLMFSTDPAAGSVARYYLENSYQQFRLQPAQETQGTVNDGIVDVRLPYAHPNFGDNYGSRSQDLVRDALAKIDEYINLKAFDRNGDAVLSSNELAIVLMVAGYENAYGGSSAPEPRVWAHKSDISAISLDGVAVTGFAMFGEQHQNHLATIGIISHEMGHLLFDLPDLYDRQGDSNGIGRWGLMGLGSWNTRGGYSGSSPAHMMAWSKAKAGFLKPEDVMGDELEFNLASATHSPEAMRVWLDPFRHGEHFLLEYRQQSQLDGALPGEGLLISHIDDWVGYGTSGPQNDVAEHKLVDIEEADGRNDLDQLENRGDRLDVYNDAYGQDYFGSSSLPASLDYQGNMSGVEISNIRVGDRVQGTITLPYQQLGDNLGHDNEVGSSWGVRGRQAISLMALPLTADLPWAHGVDIFSPGVVELDITLFARFTDGQLSAEVYSTKGRSVVRGWNRIAFDERVNLSDYDQIYLQISARADSSRPFNIDNQGQASGQSYVASNGGYQKVSFDYNQRLLVANQQQAFQYQVPKSVEFNPEREKTTSAGSAWSMFSLFLLLIGIGRKERKLRDNTGS
jgi:M6 family metalloprotease-like protein